MICDPALLLIDFQNDFCREWDEATASFEEDPRLQPAVESTAMFLDRYRSSGRTPIFVGGRHQERTVSDTWAERYDRPSGMSVQAGTEGAAFVPELQPTANDVVIEKNRYDAFYQTNLDLHLSTNNVSHVLIAGVTTNVCVMSTIHGAYNRDYRVTLLADCTASHEPELHESTLANVETHFGSIESSQEVDLPPVTDEVVME